MGELKHSIEFDGERCVACVTCCKACPTQALRVRGNAVTAKPERCIDCGECIRVCPYDAVKAVTSSPSDLKRFRYTVAIPSNAVYSQFGPDVRPEQVAGAVAEAGFDAVYDMSWMCEMVSRAIDTYLSECSGPWPKISVTCPAIIRIVQLRYPDLVPNLVPIDTPAELTAKLIRKKLSQERNLSPEQIGIFFITPCSAIMHSIVCPVGLEESYMDGAFSVAELYGPIRKAIKSGAKSSVQAGFSSRGLQSAIAGGETAMMRNANTLTLSGVQDVTYVFDRIEAGKFQSVDFIEAYICPDGCVSGPLLIEGRYAAKRALRGVLDRLGTQGAVKEETVRSLFRQHFFDLEAEVTARAIPRPPRDLELAVRLKREKAKLLELLPRKDCAACGAPSCETLALDVILGDAVPEDCVFLRLEKLAAGSAAREPAAPSGDGADAQDSPSKPAGPEREEEARP